MINARGGGAAARLRRGTAPLHPPIPRARAAGRRPAPTGTIVHFPIRTDIRETDRLVRLILGRAYDDAGVALGQAAHTTRTIETFALYCSHIATAAENVQRVMQRTAAHIRANMALVRRQ